MGSSKDQSNGASMELFKSHPHPKLGQSHGSSSTIELPYSEPPESRSLRDYNPWKPSPEEQRMLDKSREEARQQEMALLSSMGKFVHKEVKREEKIKKREEKIRQKEEKKQKAKEDKEAHHEGHHGSARKLKDKVVFWKKADDEDVVEKSGDDKV